MWVVWTLIGWVFLGGAFVGAVVAFLLLRKLISDPGFKEREYLVYSKKSLLQGSMFGVIPFLLFGTIGWWSLDQADKAGLAEAAEEAPQICRRLAFEKMADNGGYFAKEIAGQFVGSVIDSEANGDVLTVHIEGVSGTNGRCQAESIIRCNTTGGAVQLISGPDPDGYLPC